MRRKPGDFDVNFRGLFTTFILGLILSATAVASATQYSYTDTGGTVTMSGSELIISDGALGSPAGVVTMSCAIVPYSPVYFPYAAEWTCSGGSVSVASTDGSTTVSGSLTGGRLTLQERTTGGVTTYTYIFYADFSGAQTIAGSSLAVLGEVVETLTPQNSTLDVMPGTIQSGTIDVNQQYEPVYVADTGNNRIVEMADMLGSNWMMLGKSGSGVNQFLSPWGIVVDSTGHIYVVDSGNCRIARMDNISGKHWTSYGTCGSGAGQFSSPKGIWVDSGGIFVADSGNNRIVSMTDITGANFTSLGALGNGTNQFDAPTGIARDPAGKIYIADSVNGRVIRVDDMSGTNWTTVAPSVLPMYSEPLAVSVDSASRIYINYDEFAISNVVRVDDITGSNPAYFGLGTPNYLYYIYQSGAVAVDQDGAVYMPDYEDRIARFFDSTGDGILLLGNYGAPGAGVGMFSNPEGIFVAPKTIKTPIASVSPGSLTFPTEMVGTASPAQSATFTNIGSAPLQLTSVGTSTADYPSTNNCPTTLLAGESCSATVTFQPIVGGVRKDGLDFTSAHGVTNVNLKGSGALVTIAPSYLILYDGSTGTITITNPLTTSAGIKSITQTQPFYKVGDTCGLTLAPGASCTYSVSWPYTGYVQLGDIFVTDGAGTQQYVGVTGE